MPSRLTVGGWRRALASVLVLGLAGVVPFAGTAGASAAAPRNTAFTLGTGDLPDVAVAADGTAYVAWVHGSTIGDADQIQFCRILRGKRACVGKITFSLPGQQVGERPYVFLPGGSDVWILSYRCCFAPDQSVVDQQTLLLRSGNGGKTFGAPLLIGSHSAQGDAQLGPNGTVYTINDAATGGVSVQRDALDGSALPVHDQAATLDADELGGTLAVLKNGSVLAAHYDGGGVGSYTFHVSRFSGVGDPNAKASWPVVFTSKASHSPTTGGEYTEFANGKRGLYLFTEDNETYGRYQLRKWNGKTFGAPVTITPPGEDNVFPSFWQDASGRLVVAYSNSGRQMTYRATDVDGFNISVPLQAFNAYHLRGATAPDGGGWVAFDSNGGTVRKAGTVSLVAIPTRRTISESVKGSVLSGAVSRFVAGQPVALQKRSGTGWVTIATKALNSKGKYGFSLPKGSVDYRAVALVLEGYAEADGRVVNRL